MSIMNDNNGCSTCANGQEKFEVYTDSRGKECVQYDYRTEDGELFSCVSADLDTCRKRRDNWLKKHTQDTESENEQTQDTEPVEQPTESENETQGGDQPTEQPKLRFVDYSEKAFAIVGDTKSRKAQLKKLGGRYNPKLKCGAGWIFSKRRGKEVATALGFTA